MALAGATLAAAAPSGAQRRGAESAAPTLPPVALEAQTADLIRAHVRFLADDLLEGRAPGTRGGDLAARYIATQFEAMGLKPAGSDASFYQWVPMVGLMPDASIIIGAQRRTLPLEEHKDFVAWPERPESVTTLDGDVVFVGYGIDAPEWQWNDFERTPLTGKILMIRLGDPGANDSTIFRGTRLTPFGTWTYKLEQAARMGAAGVLLIHSSTGDSDPWAVIRNTWGGERLRLDRPATGTLRFAAWITTEAARRIVQATGKDYDLLLRRADARDFRPIEVGAHAAIDLRTRVRRLRSANVLAALAGASADGRNEAVIVTAHYDHYGLGAPVGGDSIYNGAIDNASGVATLLSVAQGLARAPVAPRRTVVFLATTAHEAGMHGAAAYAAAPPVPLARTAAVVEVEQANVWGITRDIVALGADLSTLGDAVNAAASASGLSTTRDPDPTGRRFYQSSPFPLAQAGVPFLSIRSGVEYVDKPPGWGADQHQRYYAGRYHRPADQVQAGFDYAGALQQARFLTRLVWQVAQDTAHASWLPESDFRTAGLRLRGQRENR